MLDLQHRAFVLGLGEALERLGHRRVGGRAERRVVELDRLQRRLPVVGRAVDVDDLELVLEQLDRRQHALAVQAVRVEAVGREVRRRDDADAVLEQRLEQPVQDHRVGDVGDVELVEADQAKALRDALAEVLERIARSGHLGELAVDLAHELVEMQARLPRQRQRGEEAVHQEALAAADAAPEVDAARDRRPGDQLGDRVRAPRLVVGPLPLAALERVDRALLGGIGVEAAFGERLLVELADSHRLAGATPAGPPKALPPPRGQRTQ